MLLFLTGMPGCGKTRWLREIAPAIHFDAWDLDEMIEAYCQATIPELFRISEAYFREQEKTVLENFIRTTKKNTILSTGGGTPCFHDNLDKMKAAGKVIYLKNTITNLLGALQERPGERPLLPFCSPLEERLRLMQKQREGFYGQADLIIPADKLTLPIFVALLEPLLKQ